jgi:hypothetical protein
MIVVGSTIGTEGTGNEAHAAQSCIRLRELGDSGISRY